MVQAAPVSTTLRTTGSTVLPEVLWQPSCIQSKVLRMYCWECWFIHVLDQTTVDTAIHSSSSNEHQLHLIPLSSGAMLMGPMTRWPDHHDGRIRPLTKAWNLLDVGKRFCQIIRFLFPRLYFKESIYHSGDHLLPRFLDS